MKRIIVHCGCGKHIATMDCDDGKDGCTIREAQGECEWCAANCGDYKNSPHWHDLPIKNPKKPLLNGNGRVAPPKPSRL